MSTTPTTNPVRDARLDQVLGLATDTARTESHGATNKKVTAAATLSVSAVEGTKTVADGVEASVTLGVSHSEKDEKAKS